MHPNDHEEYLSSGRLKSFEAFSRSKKVFKSRGLANEKFVIPRVSKANRVKKRKKEESEATIIRPEANLNAHLTNSALLLFSTRQCRKGIYPFRLLIMLRPAMAFPICEGKLYAKIIDVDALTRRRIVPKICLLVPRMQRTRLLMAIGKMIKDGR